jgi:hypothetical protein
MIVVVDRFAGAIRSHPPQPAPVLVVKVTEDGDERVLADVAKPAQGGGRLGLLVDGGHDAIAVQGERHRNDVRLTVRARGGEIADPGSGHPSAASLLIQPHLASALGAGVAKTVEVGTQRSVLIFQVEDVPDAGQVEPGRGQGTDPLQPDEIVVAVSADATVGSGRCKQVCGSMPVNSAATEIEYTPRSLRRSGPGIAGDLRQISSLGE